ncbi:MAG: conjugal transfer protein [Defluviitaleaceae bacterium]|nr:conjugal transfer protein [Defluviitaleaceae bacterium]
MEEKKDNDFILIHSYARVWRIEQKIYAIFNFVLPVPIYPRELLYFIGLLLLMFMFGGIFAPIQAIPAILRFFAIPFLLTKLLTKKKLDGKNPLKFFIGYVKFLFAKNQYYERMHKFSKTNKQNRKSYKFTWNATKCTKFF